MSQEHPSQSREDGGSDSEEAPGPKTPDTLRTGADAPPVRGDAPPGGVDAPSGPDPLVGTVIDDRYRIERTIGEGGMGIVYLATHVVLNKRLAVKVLRRDLAHDGEVVQRFVQEAQSASAIGHENIVDISDFGRLEDGSVYFVMEYLEGQDLSTLIETGDLRPDGPTLRLVRQLGGALAAAHDRGIVHRDLKPDNVFVVQRGNGERTVKVLDFGIAKVAGATGKLTRTGMVFGTPHYMSPEQASGQEVDQRTDIYALGVIMYEMFTGKVPFDADTFMGILSKHMFEAPVPPSQRIESLDGELGPIEHVILKAIAKRPEDRYQTIGALLDDLDVIEGGGQVAAPDPATQTRTDPSTAFSVPSVGSAIAATTRGADSLPHIPGLGRAGGGGGPSRWVLGVGALFAFLVVLGGAAVTAMVAFGGQKQERPDGASIVAPPAVAAPAAGDLRTPPSPGADGESGGDDPTGALPEMVSLESEPPGAEVLVAGAVVGNTPTRLPRPLEGQPREVEIRLPGHRQKVVRLSAESPRVLKVRLEEAPRRPSRPTTGNRPPEPTAAAEGPASPPSKGSGRGGRREESGGDDRGDGIPSTTIRSEVVDPWAE